MSVRVEPKIHRQEQEQSNYDLPTQDSSLSAKIFTTSSEPVNELGDRKISDKKDADEQPGMFSSILNHPATKLVGSIAITLLVGWVTNKALDALTAQPSLPTMEEAPKTRVNMESIDLDKKKSSTIFDFLSERIESGTGRKNPRHRDRTPDGCGDKAPNPQPGGNPRPRRDGGDGPYVPPPHEPGRPFKDK